MKPYKPYIPQTLSELWDQLGSMVLGATTFVDRSGYFPERSIETEFFSLNESLKLLRPKFGETNFATMMELSDRMRAYFESDPEDNSEGGLKGRECIYAMEEVIRSVRKQGRK